MPRGSNGGSTRLPEGKQWIPHVGNRQRLRELRRSWRWFEKLAAKSGTYHAAREEVIDCIARNVDPKHDEVASWMLVHAARVKARDTGKPFLDLVARQIDELDHTPTVGDAWQTNA